MNPVERAPYLLHLLGLKDGSDQLTELSPEVIKVRIFDTLRELTLRRSQRRPLVLALEDLHWIDETSEELLASMVQAIPSARILLICIYRPGYRPAWLDKSYATQIALQPLPAGESTSFVRALLGAHEVSEEVVQAILARAEGNAFFLEELARSVREQRVSSPSLAVPYTVQEVLLARIDRLPPLERRLLQTAAVVGKDVPLPLLEAVAGLPPEDLERGLNHLRASEFLYETGVGSEVEWTFKHTLIQEVAYTSMVDEDRRALHGAIVAATERLYADRLGEHIEDLGHHAFAGGAWAQAVSYLRQAGIKAARRSAHREAVACFEQALVALEHLPPGRDLSERAVDVRLDLRTSLLSLGELKRILRVMQEAEALASAIGDQARLGRVAMYMGNYFSLVGDQSRALETGQRALDIATAGGDFRLRVEAHYRLGQIHCMLGDYRRAVETLDQCVQSVSGDLIRERFGALATLSVLARNWLVRSLAERGAFDEARRRADEALRVAEATNQPIDLLIATQGMGYLHLRRGESSRAVASLERGVELCRTWHVPVWLPVVAAPLGAAYAMVGRLDDAVALLEQAVKEHAAMQRMGGHSLWVAWLSEAHLVSGRLDTAGQLAGQALTLAQTHGERGHEGWILRLLAEIAVRAEPGDPAKAEDAYRRAAAIAETLQMRPLVAHCHLGRGRLASRQGDRTAATVQLSSAIALLREMGMELWLGQAEAELSRL
jgi:tetratricopeptide (TPR) repeat protein